MKKCKTMEVLFGDISFIQKGDSDVVHREKIVKHNEYRQSRSYVKNKLNFCLCIETY